jgi:valyl-tRNA synthetase
MLHPFAPFVTDFLYRSMYKTQESVMLEQWPKYFRVTADKNNQILMSTFNHVYDFARELRIKHGLKQSNLITINLITDETISSKEINAILQPFNISIKNIANKRIDQTAATMVIDRQIIEYNNDFLNPQTQTDKIKNELNRLGNEIQRSKKILANKQFLAKAPKDKINEEEKKYHQYQAQYEKNLAIYHDLVSKK